jgi:PKD repeat protein
MRTNTLRVITAIAAAAALSACTTKKQETPGLTGPSELGTSISITVAPDVVVQDGASQSLVTITARNANGQPEGGVSLRADTRVNGIQADFGTLSARSLVTDSGGRATLTFTAPKAVSGAPATDVQIVVTPSETDFANATPRSATIHVVPSGVVTPPRGSVTPVFTVTPSNPNDHEDVLFDGSQSTSTTGTIVSWKWNFGDGRTGSGMSVSHSFSSSGTFVVTLTVTDSSGASDSTSQSVLVGQGANPLASFVVSPGSPSVNQKVNFNASASTANPGRVIRSYNWDFGDGKTGTGVTTSHSYTTAGTYTVVLVVTDDAGHKGTTTQDVTVSNGNPIAVVTIAPPSAPTNQNVSFIGSQSTAAPGRTIVSYSWNFGDGATGSGATTTHPYSTAGTYTVTLVVTDDQGNQGIATGTVTITP